ncbi:MAG TPA: choice-of-anchor Q domain-containing protein [Solirubrobacteraceae bacterium]|nr:choice-of-anchor Q domain-containing protein [Solirubrobacteraceae bacterium]
MTRLVLAAIVALLALPAVAQAEYVVTTTDDHNDGQCAQPPIGDCTLREALAAPRPADNTIVVPAGFYELTGGLTIGSDVSIVGDGALSTTIRLADTASGRVLFVDSLADASLSGVHISGGKAPSDPGGGILVEAGGGLHLADSAIEGNTADRGAGIYSSGTLVIERSTIAHNNAVGDVTGFGGGIQVGGGTASLENSTVSGNTAETQGGGIYTQANLDLTNVTIADNFGAGLHQQFGGTQRTLATNTLFARNFGGNCDGTDDAIQSTNGLSDDATCDFDGPDNQVVADSKLDFLTNNGGDTDTQAPLFDSPAVDAGLTPCVATDQRGTARPQGSECDIGAVEVIPPATLTVKTVVSDGGWLPEDFTIRVTRNGGDAIDPRPGNGTPEGDSFPVPAGTYRLGAEAARGYTATPGPGCEGDIVLAPAEIKTCTITFDFTTPPDNGLVIESYSPSRTDFEWGLNESLLVQTRGYLQDGALFGSTGIVHHAYDVAPGIRVANARTLAGADVFFTGWVPSSTYTAAEKQALQQWVLDGGTLVATTDDSGHSMVDVFGVTQADGAGHPTENVITAPDHALANGAFGVVTRYRQYDATGHYSDLGPYAHEIGRYASGPGTTLAVIEPGRIAPGSGAVILVADVDVFTGEGADFNATLIKNIFAFAAGEGARPSISIGDARATEADTTFTFPLRLSKASDAPVRVHFATANDTAAAPSDFGAAGGDLVFAAGQTVKNVVVQVHDDDAAEADERFRVQLSNATGARIADPQGIGTIVNDDAQASRQLPPPEAGESVNVEPEGVVKIKLPGSDDFIVLAEGEQLPVGTVVDVRKGRVTLTAAGGGEALFYAGIFKIAQGKGAKPLTTLQLVEKLSCPTGKAAAAAKKKRKRRLWGDGKGRFRTKGRHSAATVVGTKWLVEDRCNSTLTRVARGRVSVRDFAKKKTVIVKAGKKYVARRRS